MLCPEYAFRGESVPYSVLRTQDSGLSTRRSLQRRDTAEELRRQPEVRAARLQAGAREEAAIPGGGAAEESFQVAHDVVVVGEHLEVGEAAGVANELRHATTQRVVGYVVQHVGADHEVECLRHGRRGECAEGPLANVALAAEARHRVLARIDAHVAHARPKRAEVRLPRPLAAADVEHAAECAAEEVFSAGDGPRPFPPHFALGVHPRPSAIPLVEVGLVVSFQAERVTSSAGTRLRRGTRRGSYGTR